MRYVGALDQGTTSTRFLIVDAAGREVARHQLEHRQIFPVPGWVEHDPLEIAARVNDAIAGALDAACLTGRDLATIGITNQRETTVVWDPTNGKPWYNAIVWQDTRTDSALPALEPHRALLCRRTGLPPATYFSAAKLRWILDNVEGVRAAAERGRAVFGTMDTWVIWNLTGGREGGRHVTDITNASRTQLMDLRTRDWDDELLTIFGIPRRMLPEISPSSSLTAFGATVASGPVGAEVPIGGCLGDQHAATVGQTCFAPGEAKNTYGTGNFLVLNTGQQLVDSTAGLLTTVGYALEPGFDTTAAARSPRATFAYALEGSVAVTGAAVQWLRDQLCIIDTAADIEPLAASVADSGGVSFVPAFSGLFAPHWRPDARGVIAGLSSFHTRAHLARATLEAICFQTRDVLDAMTRDTGVRLTTLRVDGGATVNNLLMQMQADVLGLPVARPAVIETTAVGAAYAAGLAVGYWSDLDALCRNWTLDRAWEPQWSADRREAAHHQWRRAIERSF